MNRSIYFLYVFILLLTSCKTINLSQESQISSIQQVILGSIGSGKDFIMEKGFSNTAIPNYKAPIKLSVITKPFTKSRYKAFIKAKDLQPADVTVHFVDSIPKKPKYLQLQIADKVNVVSALNSIENNDIKDYLKHNSSASIIISISIALNPKDMERVVSSDAVFLVENGLKIYSLQLYKDKLKTETIHFNRGVVFDYKEANCCWSENNKRQIDIVDLVSSYDNCPNKTYRSAKRAKKKINYYKL